MSDVAGEGAMSVLCRRTATLRLKQNRGAGKAGRTPQTKLAQAPPRPCISLNVDTTPGRHTTLAFEIAIGQALLEQYPENCRSWTP